MMVFTYSGRGARLGAYVRTAATIHLFTNDLKPDMNTEARDFEEPDGELGYSPIPALASGWRVESGGGLTVRAISQPVQWTFSKGSVRIYGHYALDAAGTLLWAERLGDWQDQGPGREPIWVEQPFDVLRRNDQLHVVMTIDDKVQA